MDWLSLNFALLPILAILLLLILWRTAADIAGLVGWVLTVVVAVIWFQTPLSVSLQASLSGIIGSFPISLMVLISILQVTIMLESGAIARIVALVKSVSPQNQVVQIMIINIGFGTVLAALGATPVSILPPIMLAMGYSSFVAIALPAIGYDALCTYALLGIPVVIFAQAVNMPVNEVGIYFARFMPIISTCIGLGMLFIVGGWKMIWKGLIPTLIAGITAGLVALGMNAIQMIPLTGVAAGLAVIIVELIYLKIIRQPLFDRNALSEKDIEAEKRMPLWKALSPWIILVIFSIITNVPFLPFYNLVFAKWAMPLEIIPKEPEKLRILWQAYFWILISTFLALPFLKPGKEKMKVVLHKWLKRAPRPVLASAIFFAIAYVINHSGKGLDWTLVNPTHNMINVIASASAAGLGRFYPIIAPFLGLLGGFVSGSESSAIAMLTRLHLSTAQ
ncbi:MAG: L-lactate permease, partial [Leptolinea sp.]